MGLRFLSIRNVQCLHQWGYVPSTYGTRMKSFIIHLHEAIDTYVMVTSIFVTVVTHRIVWRVATLSVSQ